MNFEQLMIQRKNGHNKGMKYQKHKVSSQIWIVELLKRRNADLDTISKYIKCDKRTTRQLITVLRRKGHHISLLDYQGEYQYMGFFP